MDNYWIGSDREGLGLGIIDRRSEPNTVHIILSVTNIYNIQLATAVVHLTYQSVSMK